MDNASQISDNRPRRRIIPIVDARFQWKYTLLITALGVGVTAIMGAFLYKAYVDNLRKEAYIVVFPENVPTM